MNFDNGINISCKVSKGNKKNFKYVSKIMDRSGILLYFSLKMELYLVDPSLTFQISERKIEMLIVYMGERLPWAVGEGTF